MSLQVWLPLTKDLRNQGLATITSSGTPVFKSSGKLGNNCLDLNTRISFSCPALANKTIFSIAFWAKVNADSSLSTNWVDVIGFTDISSSGTSGQLRWETCYGSGYENRGISGHDNATYATCNGPNGNSTTDGKGYWHHFVFTVNTDAREYRDGILSGTYTANGGHLNGSFWLGQSGVINGEIQDVRIYDHCLSPMEVKELAKGLVLHYPLNRQGWGQDNILLNTGFQSRYTQSTGWDTTKNGTQLANSWGGYNSGVSNQATVYHAHLKQVNGEWVYEYIKTANESWLGISQGGLQSKLTAGKTYTFSWEEYHVDGTNRVGTGLYYFKTGATSANFHLGIQQASNIVREIGKWQKYSYTFIAPSDADWSKNMSWYIYGHYNGNGTFYVRHIKLEEGSIVTPWCPNSSDTLATTMGLNSTTEYDCSGFGNNGDKIGTLTYTSDTPKYQVSTHIGSTSSKIHISNFPTSGFGNSYSFAWWGKRASNSPMFWGFSDGIRLNGMYIGTLWNTGDSSNNPLYNIGTTTQVTAPSVNTWHHYVMTGNGTKCYVYLDGQLWAEAKTYKAISGTSIYINGWDSGTQYCSDNTDISDFRIYATALSADDILELYQQNHL